MTGPPPQRRLSAAGLVAALPDFALGGVFLVTWVAPGTFGRRMVAYLMLVMLIEFLIVHSAAFMGHVAMGAGDRRHKVRSLLGLGALYTLFAGGFALAFKRWWPLWAFWGLTLNRLAGVMLGRGPSGRERHLIKRSWAAGVFFYIAFVFLTTLLPVPALGITPAVVRAQELPGSGLWIDDPQRVLAFGFLYFTAWGISQLFEHHWLAGGIRASG